jgi:hypothetical protein
VHAFWVNLDSLSKVSGYSPTESGFDFERKVKEFLRSHLGYIPYLTTRIVGLSGLEHQYDAIFIRNLKTRGDLLFFECKWRHRGSAVSRYDVMIFNQKALDVYYKMKSRKTKVDLYRVFVSSVPLTFDAFRLCLSLGILTLQPYIPKQTFPPLEAAIVQLKKALHDSYSAEKSYLLDALYVLRERTIWGCDSFHTRKMESGETLYMRYKELLARTCLEVDSDWTDP